MRLGISMTLQHKTPEEWAARHRALGLRACVLPTADPETVSAYAEAAARHDIVVAEVGAWSNPLSPDPAVRARDLAYCKAQLALAEAAGARCCVNIAGARGPVWDGGYAENYSAATRSLLVSTVREIVDAVRPVRTCYALEPMPFMHPWSPEDCLSLLREIDRPGFGVHLDPVNLVSSAELYFRTGELLERCFRLLGPYIRSCHLKDVTLEHGGTLLLREVPCYEGGFDLDRYLLLAQKCDPDMPMILEHLPDEAAYLASLGRVRSALERLGIPYER